MPGGQYVNYLMPGILVQTTIFGAVGTAIGLAEDLQKGLIERFKALPMARMAVLGGRTMADTARNVMVMLIITGVGFLVGFRPHGGFFAYICRPACHVGLRLLPLVGIRLRRPGRAELRDCPGDDVPTRSSR